MNDEPPFKPVVWVGSSRKDLREFPDAVQESSCARTASSIERNAPVQRYAGMPLISVRGPSRVSPAPRVLPPGSSTGLVFNKGHSHDRCRGTRAFRHG